LFYYRVWSTTPPFLILLFLFTLCFPTFLHLTFPSLFPLNVFPSQLSYIFFLTIFLLFLVTPFLVSASIVLFPQSLHFLFPVVCISFSCFCIALFLFLITPFPDPLIFLCSFFPASRPLFLFFSSLPVSCIYFPVTYLSFPVSRLFICLFVCLLSCFLLFFLVSLLSFCYFLVIPFLVSRLSFSCSSFHLSFSLFLFTPSAVYCLSFFCL
jgi:hypothetical protein